MNYNINRRVKEIRNSTGLTQSQFGAELGQSKDVIVNIELNRNKKDINPNFLSHICKTFNVNENWLRTGEGEMFNKSNISTDPLHGNQELSPHATLILQNFLELSKSEQNEFIKLAEKIYNEDNIKILETEKNSMEIFQTAADTSMTDHISFHTDEED